MTFSVTAYVNKIKTQIENILHVDTDIPMSRD
jgi:hypothetical protein